MDYEDYLSLTYTPIKAVECLSNIIDLKINNDWNLFSGNVERCDIEELIALNYSVKLCAKHIMTLMNEELKKMYI